MKLVKKLKDHFIKKKYIFSRLQFDLIAVFLLSTGLTVGSYLTVTGIILPKLFAATSPWTQTDWSGGIGSSTSTQYSSGSNIDTTMTPGQVTLSATSGWCNNASCNSSWKYRRKITLNNTTANLGTTSEVLTNFPILVKLTSSNVDYSNTQDSGQDIRFVDPDGSALSYEIEKWDETATSYVWVKVPQIDINSNTDYIYIYYGNASASDAQNKTGVWDSSFLGVWHGNDSSSTTILDSTTNGKNATKQSSNQPNYTSSGKIAGAQTYTQGSSRGGTTVTTALTDFTVEVWFKDDGVQTAYERLADKSYTGCFWFGRNNANANSWGGGVREVSDPYGVFVTLTDGSWHQISSIRSGTTHYVYGDGGSVQNSNTVSGTACDTTAFGIGGYGDGANAAQWFGGAIDEIRLSSIARSKAWIAASYKSGTDAFETFADQEQLYQSSGTFISNIFDTGVGEAWGNLTYTASAPTNTSSTVKVRAGNNADLSDATAFISCSTVASGSDLTGGCTPDNKRYIQYQVTLSTTDTSVTPTFSDVTINFSPYDSTPPPTNASSILMLISPTGRSISSNDWNNSLAPYFTWTVGADNVGGSGLLGYCAYLGTDPAGDPATAKGVLGVTPVSIPTDSTCQFIVSGSSIDLSTSGYISTDLVSNSTYYFNIKAIDIAGNVFAGSSASFHFRHDSTAPTNVAYLTMPSTNFSNVTDMNFAWPVSGGSASSDSDSGLLGWQYQINSSSGAWQGTTHDSVLDLDYIPATASAYTLIPARDSSSVVTGNNVVYFRTVDNAGNPSSASTYRTGNLTYGGAAPTFTGDAAVTITPTSSSSNSFALSWPSATASASNNVTHYYYMVNTSPPSTLATLQGNSSTYIDNGTETTVSTAALSGVNKGGNTVYVVAIDNATTPNYSPSNYISGTFTLNSTDPDNVGDLVASDSSIKSKSQWNVTLTWTTPAYQGAGNLTYIVKRSTDNVTFTQVGTSSGLSYVDNTPASALYYYKVYTKDGASALSSGTNAVSITPTGKWTTAPTLDTGPVAGSITVRKATITWTTGRTSDSKVQYGTTSGSYNSVEPSSSTQVASHSIQLTGLNPGTTYYYKAKWTDEDGNTGTSDEKSFSTSAAPTAKNVSVTNIGLTSGLINYTVTGASSIKIYYGTTTSFGGSTTISTSTSETSYTTLLTGLLDGTKYYYKINAFDSDGSEYEGTVLDFTTLPRPKITDVRIQQVANTAQSTILVTWTTNTEVSSIVTYYPQGAAGEARDEVNVALVKGDHRAIIRGLLPKTDYTLIVKGRDKVGNEAVSDSQRITTATDTRPPQISELHVEGTNTPVSGSNSQDSTAQLVVSWNTDEQGTSQVEFGEGTGTTYAQKTQEDTNLTTNHIVIISGLTSSKVYHLRALSKDAAGNLGNSIDTVTITPKVTENALNLVITNLQAAFGFLGGLKR